MAVVADPLTAASPTDAVGFAKPEKVPGRSAACIADSTMFVPLPLRY